MLFEPAVKEFDGMDGAGAGAVQDLLAARGARRDDDSRGDGSVRGGRGGNNVSA